VDHQRQPRGHRRRLGANRGGHPRFLVPAGTEGFRAVDVHDKLSLVASTTSELLFEDCRVRAMRCFRTSTRYAGRLSV